MGQQTLFKVRDLRKKDQYKIDDIYLNGYARIFGPTTTAVYNSLSRHAEFHTQEAFPSEELIAEEHGITARTVRLAIKKLKSTNIIDIERNRNRGKWMSNTYYLIDKSEWKPPEEIKDLWLNQRKKTTKTRGSQRPIKDNKPTIKDNKDNDVSPRGATSPSKTKQYSDLTPISLLEFQEWCKKSNQRHIQIIGEWAEAEEPNRKTKGQWEEYINRNLRPSRMLVSFTQEQLQEAFDKLLKDVEHIDKETGKKVGYLTKYGLETLRKYL